MATRILILTVGSSCAPIVYAIRYHQADYVYFICSRHEKGREGSSRNVDGPGAVCGGANGSSIVAQTGLTPDRYKKFEIDDPDDLPDCYATVNEAFAAALARDPDASILADYTGGTKSMTAALVRVATGRYTSQTDLFVVTMTRDKLDVVRDGTEVAQSQNAAAIVLEEPFQEALRLANAYHYAAAAEILQRILSHRPAPPPTLRREAQHMLVICRGFDAWDRFDHKQAYALLQPEAARLEKLEQGLISTIRTLADVAAAPDESSTQERPGAPPAWGAPAVLPVYDLLHNAERRAKQGRYDDAVARHYRALELLAQNRLRAAHDINSSNVDAEKAGAWLATNPAVAAETPIKIGLAQDYDLLNSLGDPLGALWAEEHRRLHNVLERRNQSILAHGLKPVAAEEYAALSAPSWQFVERAVEVTQARLRTPAQFPQIDRAHLHH